MPRLVFLQRFQSSELPEATRPCASSNAAHLSLPSLVLLNTCSPSQQCHVRKMLNSISVCLYDAGKHRVWLSFRESIFVLFQWYFLLHFYCKGFALYVTSYVNSALYGTSIKTYIGSHSENTTLLWPQCLHVLYHWSVLNAFLACTSNQYWHITSFTPVCIDAIQKNPTHLEQLPGYWEPVSAGHHLSAHTGELWRRDGLLQHWSW